MKRCCFACSSPIFECMGFVVAGDFQKLIANNNQPSQITTLRELCARCGLLALENPEPIQKLLNATK